MRDMRTILLSELNNYYASKGMTLGSTLFEKTVPENPESGEKE